MPQAVECEILSAYLAKHCRGREAARPKRRILRDVRAAGLGLGDRDFDQAMHALAMERPVGSSDKGFFWCLDDEDFQAAYGYLVTRFRPMRERAEAIRRQGEERLRPAAGAGVLFDAWGRT